MNSVRTTHGTVATTIEGLGPRAYTVDVTGLGVGTPVAAVSSTLLVWNTERA